MQRLCWHHGDEAITYEFLERFARNTLPRSVVFFLDTAIVTDHELPAPFWQLLNDRRIAITPSVLYELQDWIRTPRCNEGFREDVIAALTGGCPRITVIDFNRFAFNTRHAAQYYIRLLGLRKVYPVMVREKLEEQGTPFTEKDVEQICQKDLQDRGWRIAKKAMGAGHKTNMLADEELVVWCILCALLTGVDTVILTRDSDVLEQFYKALYLIDTHYHSMLIGDAYALHPWLFRHEALGASLAWMREAFQGEDDSLIQLPKEYETAFLPSVFHPVTISCWMLRGRPPTLGCSSLSFIAEREMQAILDVKTITGGLNTHRLHGRNCHICPAPNHQHIFGGWGIISKDVQIGYEDTKISVTDANLSIMRIEKIARVASCLMPPGFQ